MSPAGAWTGPSASTTTTKAASHVKCENYRWCGYAEAHAGRELAQRNLASLFRPSGEMKWAEAKERYDWLLRPVSGTAVERLPVFSSALALGSREFILETYVRFPTVFGGRKPSTGARHCALSMRIALGLCF